MSRIRYAFVWGSLYFGLITGTATLLTRKFLFGYPINNILFIILSYLIYMAGGFCFGYVIYPHQKKKRKK
jgi:hypothetical protein